MRSGRVLAPLRPWGRVLFLALWFLISTNDGELFAEKNSIGAKTAGDLISSTWPIRSPDDPVSLFIRSLGKRLVSPFCREKADAWSFQVIRDLELKAFSVAGKSIYVSDGAVAAVVSESELAAILAHEVGHHLAGHFQEFESSFEIFPGHNFFMFFSKKPETPRKKSVHWNSFFKQMDTPEKEVEADRYAFALLQHAGFNPKGLLDLIQRLGGGYSSTSLSGRISRIEKKLEKTPPGPPNVSETREFKQIQEFIKNQWRDFKFIP